MCAQPRRQKANDFHTKRERRTRIRHSSPFDVRQGERTLAYFCVRARVYAAVFYCNPNRPTQYGRSTHNKRRMPDDFVLYRRLHRCSAMLRGCYSLFPGPCDAHISIGHRDGCGDSALFSHAVYYARVPAMCSSFPNDNCLHLPRNTSSERERDKVGEPFFVPWCPFLRPVSLQPQQMRCAINIL